MKLYVSSKIYSVNYDISVKENKEIVGQYMGREMHRVNQENQLIMQIAAVEKNLNKCVRIDDS
jgi:hypothetical protein